jgi:hypothetical protein
MKPATMICTKEDTSTAVTKLHPALQNLQATNPDGQEHMMDFDPMGDWHQLLGAIYAAS